MVHLAVPPRLLQLLSSSSTTPWPSALAGRSTRASEMYVGVHEMDFRSGVRMMDPKDIEDEPLKTWKNLPYRVIRALF